MKTVLILSSTLVLAGCLATTPLTDKSIDGAPRPAETSAPGPAAASTSPSVPSLAQSVTRTLGSWTKTDNVQDAFDLQRAELDLVKPDGAACTVVSDGGVASNIVVMGQIGLTLAAQRFVDGRAYNAVAFQNALTGVRPQLKQLSRQVLWLPLEAEGFVGEQYLKLGEFANWAPTNPAHRRFVQQTLTPLFQQMKGFAEDDLGSGLRFEMRIYLNAQQTSPEMLPGGFLMIPSGMVTMLAAQKDVARMEQALAFQMAHEFSHALRRHTTKSVQARLIDGLTIAEVFNKQFQGTQAQLLSLNSSNIAQMFNLGQQGVGQVLGALCATENVYTAFDQTQELEADTCGALLLDKLSKARRVVFDPLVGLQTYRSWSAAHTGADPLAPAPGRVRGAAAQPVAQQLQKANTPFCIKPASHPQVEVREAHLGVYVGYIKEGRIPPGLSRKAGNTGNPPQRK